nr:hypothetical protein [Microbacterium ihumii]
MPGGAQRSPASGRHGLRRQRSAPAEHHELLDAHPPFRLLGGVEVVVLHPRGVGMPEPARDDIIRPGEQAAAREHGVQELLLDTERVERDDRDAAGDRLDRRRRTDSDQSFGARERESHRLVREHEVRGSVREQLGIRIAFEVRLGLPRPRAQLHDDPPVRPRFSRASQDTGELLPLVALRRNERLRGEHEIRAPMLALGHEHAAGVRTGCADGIRPFRPAPRRPREPTLRRSRPRIGEGGEGHRHAHAEAVGERLERPDLAVRMQHEQVGLAAVLECSAQRRDRHSRQAADDDRPPPQAVDDPGDEPHERSPSGEDDDVGQVPVQPSGELVEPQACDRIGAEDGTGQSHVLLLAADRQRRPHEQHVPADAGHRIQQRRRPLHEGVGIRDRDDTKLRVHGLRRPPGAASPSAPAHPGRRA